MSLITYINPHTREEEHSNERSVMSESALSQEQVSKMLLQVMGHRGKQGVGEVDLHAAAVALEEMAIRAAMFKMWNDDEIELGWDGEEFVVFATGDKSLPTSRPRASRSN